MPNRLIGAFVVFSLLSIPAAAQFAYLFSDGNLPGTLAAYKALLAERPDLQGRIAVDFLTESLFDEIDPGGLARADVLVLDIMNQEMLDRFNVTHDVDIIGSVSRRGMVLAVGQGLTPRDHYVDQGAVWDARARAFWANWGFANQLGLVKLALSYAGVAGLTVPAPQPSLEAGYYYPDGETGQVFATWDEFDGWRQARGKRRPGAPRIAVGFYKSTYYAGDTALLDAVIAEIERRGAEAIPVFGYPAALTFEQLLLDADGRARADAALTFLFRFADFDASRSLEKLDIPVLSLVSLYGRSEAEWRASPQGLTMFEGTFQVAVPELAGLVAPTVIGSQERVDDPETGLTIVVRRPIASRVILAVEGLTMFEGTFQVAVPELAGLVAPTVIGSQERVDAAEGILAVPNNVTRLMDQAVQRVKMLDEAENYVRRHYLRTKRALIERGYSERINDYDVNLHKNPELARPARRGAHLRRAARDVQPEHFGYRRRQRDLGHRPRSAAASCRPAAVASRSATPMRTRPARTSMASIPTRCRSRRPGSWGSTWRTRCSPIVETHGAYPEKVSFVIWGDETMRHEGVLESQIFHLLGTRPVWDARGKVIDVDVIPRPQLGRPRVDIVIASAAEGMFQNVTRLMDQAVQRVKMLDEAENYVRRHYLRTKRALIERGYSEDDADRRAGVRIFDEPPGTFNLNTSAIVAASGTWDTDQGMADEYLSKMGHGFGNGFWGEPMEDVFRLALSGTDKVVHSSSTMLYGALDNDDFFMYMGGLAAAVRNLDGETPELVVTNTRDPGRPEMTSIDKFIGTEFRSRYVNPTWIEGMQHEGYAGAGEMRAFVEYLWGWDATVSEAVDDAMWQESFAVYVEDKHDLGMKAFFDDHSPFAYQDMTGRMAETIRKGYWAADAATEATLLRQYVDSVNTHGVGCSAHTCGNPRFLQYVLDQGRLADIPVPALETFREAMEQALGVDIRSAAEAAEAFVRRNEARPAELTANLEGYRMEEALEEAVPRCSAAERQWRRRVGRSLGGSSHCGIPDCVACATTCPSPAAVEPAPAC